VDQIFEHPPAGDKETIYRDTVAQLESLLAEDDNLLASLANTTALLKLNFASFTWVGFYLESNGELVVGPFQGKPACVRIKPGKGVCGAAAERMETVIVSDVSKFPGHIACDPMSRSEIVVPIQVGGRLVGVLDVDSQGLSDFNETDRAYLEKIVEMLKPKFRSSSREGESQDA
jgi:L-methionine (R)-S-oxide reductase